jgi:putative transposase
VCNAVFNWTVCSNESLWHWRISACASLAARHAATSTFAELQAVLAYKAALDGSVCVKVNADYTSQTCPTCGYTSKASRTKQGLLSVCQGCSHRLHADRVDARNIALRTLLVRQDWTSTGQLSFAPDVTDHEDIRCTPLEVFRS